MTKFLFCFLLLGCVGALCARQIGVPAISRRVTDQTGTLSQGEVQSLETQLQQFERETSNQIIVLIVPTTGDEDIFDFTQRVGEKNGIGQKGKNNGVILTVAKNDRKIRIHPGYGLEGVLPDAVCDQIIRTIIRPKFRSDDFYGGIRDGAEAIMQATKGEFTGEQEDSRGGKRHVPLLFIVFFIIFMIFNVFRGARRTLVGPRRYYSSGPWWGGGFGGGGFGGGGGGFSGGGFSGGDGSFGGGGASGSW